MREESAPNLIGIDIISDRLSFAARALPQIAILRDKYEGLITQLNDTLTKARSIAGAAANSEPPPKRMAATGSAVRVRATRGWSASKQAKQAKEAGDTRSYVSVINDEVVTVVRYTTGEGGAFVDADGDVNLDAAWFEVELDETAREASCRPRRLAISNAFQESGAAAGTPGTGTTAATLLRRRFRGC